jgi:hypothetical protein
LIFADQIKVISKSPIRPSDTDNKTIVEWADVGEVFDVVSESGAWHYVKFISGTEHVGKSGWVFRGLIDYSTGKIKGKGAVVHAEPSTKSPPIEDCNAVKGGTVVELIKKDVKWYKIADGKYIYHKNVKKLE